jgi:hypothetical protein
VAVIKEGITPNGVRYRICDDAYINASPEEIAHRRAAANAIAHKILLDWARKHPGETYSAERTEANA